MALTPTTLAAPPETSSPPLFSVTSKLDENDDEKTGYLSDLKETDTSAELEVQEQNTTTTDSLPGDQTLVEGEDGGKEEKNVVKANVTKDPEFYMEMTVFKIEDTLFRVPAQLFASNAHLSHLISTKQSTTSSEGDKVIEWDVDKSKFRALVKLFNAMPLSPEKTTREEWISALDVSTFFFLFDIRDMAIKQLTSASIPIVDRIYLAKEHIVDSWLLSSYTALIDLGSQLSTLGHFEMKHLGLETIFKLYRSREIGYPLRRSISDEVSEIHMSFAKSELETLMITPDLITCAKLAVQYDVREWWILALTKLMDRTEMLTVEEAQDLGVEDTVAVFRARELVRSSKGVRAKGLKELSLHRPNLKSRTAVERLGMAREYGIRTWAHDAFRDLIVSDNPLSVSEAHEIGLKTAISICRVRPFDYEQPSLSKDQRQVIVETEFAEELSEIREEISEAKLYQEEKRRLREGKELDLERTSVLLTEAPTDKASSLSIPASQECQTPLLQETSTSNAELPTTLTSATSSPPPSFDDSDKAIKEFASMDEKNKKEELIFQRKIVQLRRTPLKRS